ncbi:MAG: RNA polymerase sigma factor [Isosphaeraceae bacterium]
MRSHHDTSRSLLIRARSNDQEAWRRLVDLYSPLVAHWCQHWGASPADVPDLVQEVFAAVAPGLATFRHERPGGTFRGWLRGIAQNKVRDHFRRGCGSAEGGTEALIRLQEVPVEGGVPDATDCGADTNAEVAALYRRALEQVRCQFEERTGLAFWKVAVEDRSPADVADELGLRSTFAVF